MGKSILVFYLLVQSVKGLSCKEIAKIPIDPFSLTAFLSYLMQTFTYFSTALFPMFGFLLISTVSFIFKFSTIYMFETSL